MSIPTIPNPNDLYLHQSLSEQVRPEIHLQILPQAARLSFQIEGVLESEKYKLTN
jgi:hypothetical protein